MLEEKLYTSAMVSYQRTDRNMNFQALSLFQHLHKASIYALLPFFLNERPLLLQAPSKQMLGFKLDASTGINLSLWTWF